MVKKKKIDESLDSALSELHGQPQPEMAPASELMAEQRACVVCGNKVAANWPCGVCGHIAEGYSEP